MNILFRADDAGSCISANEAIEEVANAGVARNVSIMVCGPAFDDAAARFAKRRDVCLGLHATLNAEWTTVRWGPLLPPEQVPTLLDEQGFFTPTPNHLHQRGFSVDEAVAEVKAQLQKARVAGLPITYLDEHMVVGWLPGLRDALADLCRQEGVLDAMALNPMPLRYSQSELPTQVICEEIHRDDTTRRTAAEELATRWLVALQAATERKRVSVMRSLAPGARSHEVFSSEGTYLVVTHPGKVAQDMNEFYHEGQVPGQVAAERDIERQALSLPDLRERLQQMGVTIARYDTI